MGHAFLLALGLYFLAQVAIRVVQQGALELDEAEQVFDAQRLRLGYGSQPPLYAWLQWTVFQLTGVNHVGLSVLKNALLFALYASVYQLARLLLGALAAMAIAASLVLLVPLGWEAQIDRTHSLLATALAAGALWTYFALLREPGKRHWVLLGLLLGLGMQSKYNFVVFALGLAAASLLVREHRKQVWTGDIWIAVSVAALCLLPHASWFIEQFDTATAQTLNKMNDIDPHAGYATNVASGIKHLLLSIASFVTPLWIVLAFAYRSPRHGTLRSNAPDARFFFWFYTSALACIAALVLSGHLAHIKSRWLQPLLFSVPLACFVVFVPESPSVYRRLLRIAIVVGLAMMVVLAVRPQLQLAFGRNSRIHEPFPELASELGRRFPDTRLVAVEDRYVGGNVRMQWPTVSVILLDELCGQAPFVEGRVLVLTQAPLRGCPGLAVVQAGQVSPASLRFNYALVERQRK
jgi:4-amino-4-deoxy-L-arabinose transferase-like glycosyltransferase